MSFDWRERAKDRVEDIIAAIDDIGGFLDGFSEGSFIADRRTVFAVTHLVQNIGEAAKNLAPGIEARHPHIPWPDVRSMRERIVHEYWTVDPHILWRVATDDLAPLRAAMLAERDWLDAQ